jgi:hypothetical protein
MAGNRPWGSGIEHRAAVEWWLEETIRTAQVRVEESGVVQARAQATLATACRDRDIRRRETKPPVRGS